MSRAVMGAEQGTRSRSHVQSPRTWSHRDVPDRNTLRGSSKPPVWRSNGVRVGGGPRRSRAARACVDRWGFAWRVGPSLSDTWRRSANHGAIRTQRAEPTRMHDRSTSMRREKRRLEVPRPAAAASRNGALESAAVAAERAESTSKVDGVPAVGPDEGPGSKTRAEAVVWGHGEPRREKVPYIFSASANAVARSLGSNREQRIFGTKEKAGKEENFRKK